MEVKIGVKGTAREIAMETATSADEIAVALSAAIAEDAGVFTLSDEKGRQVLIPADKIAYIEIGEPIERRVGFGAM